MLSSGRCFTVIGCNNDLYRCYRRGARWAGPRRAQHPGAAARPAGRPASGRGVAALKGLQRAGLRSAAPGRGGGAAARRGSARWAGPRRAQHPGAASRPAGRPASGRRAAALGGRQRAGPHRAAPGSGAPPRRASAAQVPRRALLLVSRAFWRLWSRDGRAPAVARHSLGSADYFCKKSPSAFRSSWHVLALGRALQNVSGVLWCF